MPQRATATDFSLVLSGYGLVEKPGRLRTHPHPRAAGVTGPHRAWLASMGSPVTPGSVSIAPVDGCAVWIGGRP